MSEKRLENSHVHDPLSGGICRCVMKEVLRPKSSVVERREK